MIFAARQGPPLSEAYPGSMHMVYTLLFRGLGFRVQGLGLGINPLGLGCRGFGFRNKPFRFWV